MRSLKGKTMFITGASRGIGRAIARAAADGSNIAIASKTDEPNPKLPGTIHTVADEIIAAGGRALRVCGVCLCRRVAGVSPQSPHQHLDFFVLVDRHMLHIWLKLMHQRL
jgi:NAD(P)-dependent dehydrogenase (short-subunit alcohol dehydrogenase family)